MVFKLDFRPNRHGWHFANNFVSSVFAGITTKGLCGGMAATAWDYYAAGIPIPSHWPADFPDGPTGSHVPPSGTPLREYIYQRQMDTLGIPFHVARWIIDPFRLNDANYFRTEVHNNEFPKLRKQLEVDRSLGIVGLFSPVDGNPFGHQVLAYGFDDSPSAGGVGILVYDSNHPDKEVLIAPSTSADARQTFELRVDGRVVDHYRGWFFMDFAYDRHNPVRPRYQDLVVSGQIWVSNYRPQVGAPLEIQYTVTNIGQAPAHLDQLYIWMRKDGANRDDLAGGGDGNATPILPGASRTIHTSTEAASGPAGAYRAGASYLHRGVWRNLPGGPGKAAQIDFAVAPADARPSGWRDLGHRLATDVAAGVYADGRMAVFGVSIFDGGLWHKVQTASNTDESWTDWTRIGLAAGFTGRPVIGVSADQRLEVFVRSGNGELWHVWQTEPNGRWSGWERRGDRCTSDPAVYANADGRLELFVCREGGEVFHAYQRVVNGFWSGMEPFRGGILLDAPSVAANPDGRMEVFGRGLDGGLFHVWQTAPNGDWTDWAPLGGVLVNGPTVRRHASGTLEVYGTGLDHKAWHIWQQAGTPNGWSGWTPYGGTALPADARYAAEVNSTGGVSLFVRGGGGEILHRHHIAREPWWSEWISLGGTTVGDLAAVRRPDGRLALFSRGPARNLVYRYQMPDGSWVR